MRKSARKSIVAGAIFGIFMGAGILMGDAQACACGENFGETPPHVYAETWNGIPDETRWKMFYEAGIPEPPAGYGYVSNDLSMVPIGRLQLIGKSYIEAWTLNAELREKLVGMGYEERDGLLVAPVDPVSGEMPD